MCDCRCVYAFPLYYYRVWCIAMHARFTQPILCLCFAYVCVSVWFEWCVCRVFVLCYFVTQHNDNELENDKDHENRKNIPKKTPNSKHLNKKPIIKLNIFYVRIFFPHSLSHLHSHSLLMLFDSLCLIVNSLNI